MLILAGAGDLPEWDAASLRSLLDELRRAQPGLTVEWDLDAGEEWCRIRHEDDVVAQIRAPTAASSAARFAFVNPQHQTAANLLAFLRAHDVEIVEADDFDAPTFSVRREDLAAFTSGPLPPEHAFNPDRFAANDLVFVTE